jgi:hypothetical protein
VSTFSFTDPIGPTPPVEDDVPTPSTGSIDWWGPNPEEHGSDSIEINVEGPSVGLLVFSRLKRSVFLCNRVEDRSLLVRLHLPCWVERKLGVIADWKRCMKKRVTRLETRHRSRLMKYLVWHAYHSDILYIYILMSFPA